MGNILDLKTVFSFSEEFLSYIFAKNAIYIFYISNLKYKNSYFLLLNLLKHIVAYISHCKISKYNQKRLKLLFRLIFYVTKQVFITDIYQIFITP